MAYYKIKSQMCDVVLDVEGEGGSGSRVITWESHGKDNQVWFDDPATGTIRSKVKPKCCITFDGEQLVIKKYEPGNPQQQWMRQGRTIRNRVDHSQVIDIYKKETEKGATVGSFKYKGGENQHWTFEYVGGQAEGFGSPYYQGQKREFYIVSEMNGKVLDICQEKMEPGGKIIMYKKHDEKKPNQLWYLDNLGMIRSSLCDLTFSSAAKSEQLTTCMPGVDPRSQWMIQGNKIISRGGEHLDIYKRDDDDGAKVCSYDPNDAPNQCWRIEYV